MTQTYVKFLDGNVFHCKFYERGETHSEVNLIDVEKYFGLKEDQHITVVVPNSQIFEYCFDSLRVVYA